MKRTLLIISLSLGMVSFLLGQAPPGPYPQGTKPVNQGDGVWRFDRPGTTLEPAFFQQLAAMFKFLKPPAPLPFGRSIAFLVGVGSYRHLDPLPHTTTDVTKMRNFLLEHGGFDTVFEVRDDRVSSTLLNTYMLNYFSKPDSKYLTPRDRFLFYYSGHGGNQGELGYLLFANAHPKDNDYVTDALEMNSVRHWAYVNVARQVLMILDTCNSGLAVQPLEDPGGGLGDEPSGILMTAGTGNQEAYQVANNQLGYGVFTHAILEALQTGMNARTAFIDVFAVYSHARAVAYNFEIEKGRKMQPDIDNKLRRRNYDHANGNFVFLNLNPIAKDARQDNSKFAGLAVQKEGANEENAQEVESYQKRAKAGDAGSMGHLGWMYAEGQDGLPKDDFQAVYWSHKAADAGDTFGMVNLGLMYSSGRGGLPMDDVQALYWFRKAAQKGNGGNNTDSALLSQSYILSQHLGGRERVYQLSEQCRVSTEPAVAAKSAQEWCLKLYEVASAEPNVQIRIVGQKNALMFLSYRNPALAMTKTHEIDLQRPSPGQMMYEDPRSAFLETMFLNFLALGKPQGISEIIALANYVGQTGQYPYRAMAAVMERLEKSGESEKSRKANVNAILSDALAFYTQETGYYNRDEEFLVLLRSLSNSGVDRDLAEQASALFVHHLMNDPVHVPGDYYAEVHVADKVVSFTDRNETFLFQAFPSIRQFNPILAGQLSRQRPELNQASDKMQYISGGFIMGNPTSQQAKQQHLKWLQESLVARIRAEQDSNPELMVQLAQRLSDLSSRIVAYSAIVPALGRTNPGEARSVYEHQLSEIGNLDKSLGRLHALVALAQAAASVGDTEHYQSLSTEAFDLGMEYFTQATEAVMRVQRRSGFDELEELVGFAASQPGDILKARVQRLPDDWLKAYLWLYEAEGQARVNTPRAQPAGGKGSSDN
jgi:TPR repeat protein